MQVLDDALIDRWLSPGGSADLLALALFLDKLPRWFMRPTWANPQPMGN